MDTFAESRRQVLKGSAAAIAIGTIGSLTGLHTNQARAANGDPTRLAPIPSPYGLLSPVADRNTGPPRLQLPTAFSYQLFGWTGDAMANRARAATTARR